MDFGIFEQVWEGIRDSFSGSGGTGAVSPGEAAELFRQPMAVSCGGMAELADSVARVANDMNMPVPGVYASENSFGEHLANDPANPFDDAIGADPDYVSTINELSGDPRAFDVVSAHEMGHAKIAASGLRRGLSPHAEELLCDVNAGLYAGKHGVTTAVYDKIIAETPADADHPAGDVRVEVFHAAREIGGSHHDPDMPGLVDQTLREVELERLCDTILENFNVVV